MSRHATAFDACIFGAGPAGAATAIRLAGAGASVALVDNAEHGVAWGGETVAGAVRHPLGVLGVWERFLAAGHQAGYEIRAAWGAREQQATSAIFQAYCHNWHIDRARFDRDLRDAAAECGCAILRSIKPASVRRENRGWTFPLESGTTLRARILVDATGRCCALGRRLGARRRHFDRLIALIARVPRHRDPAYAHALVVEARANGWWYAAPVPGAHVLAYLTDRDLAERPADVPLRVVAADTALTDYDSQAGWLPAGDALAAHDPLWGSGILHALESGIRAADAIAAFLQTADGSALESYRVQGRAEFDRYLEGLTARYALERRWPSSAFWGRRNGVRMSA